MKNRPHFSAARRLVPALLIGLAGLLGSCKSTVTQAPTPATTDDTASFYRLQKAVFNQSCTQCHTASLASLNGLLDLDSDVAYANLVGASPTNSVAVADSFMRVKPSHPELSFMLMKLTPGLGAGLGDQMPKTGHPLSPGKREFIKEWIQAGAPLTGNVADPALLLDTTEDPQAPLAVLPAPAPGTGFQIHMPPFEIQPGTEREIFLYKSNPNLDTQYVRSVDIRMREGSHHFILWGVDGSASGLTDGMLRDRTDNEMARPRDFINGAQTNELHYDFPAGVAVAIPPNQGFDLNSHYVNPTSHVIYGESYMNLYTMPAAQVQHIAVPFLISDGNFHIPAHATYTRKYNWPTITTPTHLIMLTSHAHKHMVSFKVWRNGPTGELIYSNTDWHEPTVFTGDILLNKGDKLYSETTWQNDNPTPLQFGFTSEDEMNILLGYTWQ